MINFFIGLIPIVFLFLIGPLLKEWPQRTPKPKPEPEEHKVVCVAPQECPNSKEKENFIKQQNEYLVDQIIELQNELAVMRKKLEIYEKWNSSETQQLQELFWKDAIQ